MSEKTIREMMDLSNKSIIEEAGVSTHDWADPKDVKRINKLAAQALKKFEAFEKVSDKLTSDITDSEGFKTNKVWDLTNALKKELNNL